MAFHSEPTSDDERLLEAREGWGLRGRDAPLLDPNERRGLNRSSKALSGDSVGRAGAAARGSALVSTRGRAPLSRAGVGYGGRSLRVCARGAWRSCARV